MKIPSPSEAQVLQNARLKPDIEAFRQRVANAIVTTAAPEVWIDIRGIENSVCDVIMQECREAGWQVRIQTDSRDGDALVLSRPR